MTRIAAVILAGGKGERLGGTNKALLAIGGERFVDRAMAVTVTVGCAPRLLAVGRRHFAAPEGLTQILDLDTDYGGPLAGVAAAVEHLAALPIDLLFSLAVDTPLFPPDFLARALPLMESAPAVVGRWGGQDYPTNAVWRLAALRDLPAAMRAGTAPHSLKRLAEALGGTPLDYSQIADPNPFRNANTPEELAVLRREVEGRDLS